MDKFTGRFSLGRSYSEYSSSERGLAVKGLLVSIVLLALVAGALLYTFGSVVPPGVMGVRQISFGPGQGFSDRALAPGYHWSIPAYSKIHMVPRTVQILNLTRETEGDRARSGIALGSLEIQTADRASVDVDISILSVFYPRSGTENGRVHGGPAELLQRIGIEKERWDNHIRRTVDDQLKRTLGTLSNQDFYNPFKREEQIAIAQSNMNTILAPEGMKIEGVLLRRYTFREERIENAIFQKNLQDQEERLNTTAGLFAAAQAQLEQVAAEWDAKIETLKVEGENKANVVRSEGMLYESEKRAGADLLVAKARAEVDKEKSAALSQSAGARVHVAREIAPLLSSLRGGVVADVDPYNIEAWMKKLGVSER